ncbi:MAG: hypothetical protein IKA22_05365 [Lentisphaeria bacterium]|nr:hypothetical protein [Lentisphaeria bacterium]
MNKVLFSAAVLTCIAYAEGKSVNIFPDGNFENQKIVYRFIGNVRGSVSYDSVNAAEGKYSLKVTSSAKGNVRGYSGQLIRLNQKKAAPLSVSYKGMRKGSGKTLAAVDLVITYDNGQKIYFFRGLELTGDTGGKWITKKTIFKPVRPIKSIEVWPIVNGDICTAYFDDIKIMTEESSFAEEKTEDTVIRNEQYRIIFSDFGNIFALTQLENLESKSFFIRKSTARVPVNLWSISFLLPDKRIVTVEQGKISKISSDKTGKLHFFDWNDLTVPGTKSKFSVRVTLDLSKEKADWRIAVNGKENIYNIAFPCFSGIGKLGKNAFDDYVVIPDKSGILQQDYSNTGSVNLIYGAGAPMQFFAFYDKNGGLYLSTYDDSMLAKTYNLSRQLDNSLIYSVSVMPGLKKEYRQNFPFVMQFFKGDWFDAAQIYRKWAVNQSWCKAGKLSVRKNELVDSIHVWIKGGALNKTGYTYPVQTLAGVDRLSPAERFKYSGEIAADYTAKELIELAGAIGKNSTAVWLTDNWHTGGCFGITPVSPEYQARKGLPELTGLLNKANIAVVPYVNFGRWDTELATYDADVMIRNYDLKVRSYPAHSIAQGAICHADGSAEKLWNELARRIASYGCSGIYLDELSTNGNPVCYADNHMHKAGSSDVKIKAQRKNVIAMKNAAAKIKKNYFTMGEQGSETYIGANDINIWWKSSEGDGDIPLFETVYHDYCIGMGRVPGKWYGKHMEKGYPDARGNAGMEEFMLNIGKSFVHGLQLGIIRQDMKKYSPEAVKYIADMVKMREKLLPYMHYGQLLRSPEVLYPTEKMTVKQSFLGFLSVPTSSILSGTFKADDGSVATVFLNISGKEQKIYYAVSPFEQWGFNGNYELTEMTVMKEQPRGVLKVGKNHKYTFSLTLPAYSPAAVVWNKSSRKESGTIGMEKVPEEKVTVDVYPVSSQIKAGDNIFFDIKIKNNSADELKLSFNWILPEKWQKINVPSEIILKSFSEIRLNAEFGSVRTFKVEKRDLELEIVELKKKFKFNIEQQLPRNEFEVCKSSADIIKRMRELSFDIDTVANKIELKVPEKNSHSEISAVNACGFAAYDDDGLHFLFKIKGAKHFDASHSADIWKGSCMQFALNGMRLKQPYALSFAAAKTSAGMAVFDFFTGKFTGKMNFNWKNNGEAQYYYLCVPWNVLNFSRVPVGKKISFSVTYNNCDGKEFAGYLEWTKGVCGGVSPNEYGDLVICS